MVRMCLCLVGTHKSLDIERGSWSALLARCCLLGGYWGPVEKREEDAVKRKNKRMCINLVLFSFFHHKSTLVTPMAMESGCIIGDATQRNPSELSLGQRLEDKFQVPS